MKLDHVSLCAQRKIVLTLLVADKMVASNQAPFKKGGLEGIACACVKIPRKLGIKSA